MRVITFLVGTCLVVAGGIAWAAENNQPVRQLSIAKPAPTVDSGGNISSSDLSLRSLGEEILNGGGSAPTLGSYFAPTQYDYLGAASPWRGCSTFSPCFSQIESNNVTCTYTWLGIDASLEVGSNHIWHGYDLNSHIVEGAPANPSNRLILDGGKPTWYWAPMLDATVGGTSFHANIQGFLHAGEWEERNSFNYMFYWDQLYQEFFQLRFGYNYYDFQHEKADWANFHEAFAGVVLPAFPLRPSYHIFHDWYDSDIFDNGAGNFHVFGLSEALPAPLLITPNCYQEFTLSWDLWFNDGFNGADSDWSHSTLGIETDIPLGCGATLTPGVYYQSSFEESVNNNDECWAKVMLYLPLTTASQPFPY